MERKEIDDHGHPQPQQRHLQTGQEASYAHSSKSGGEVNLAQQSRGGNLELCGRSLPVSASESWTPSASAAPSPSRAEGQLHSQQQARRRHESGSAEQRRAGGKLHAQQQGGRRQPTLVSLAQQSRGGNQEPSGRSLLVSPPEQEHPQPLLTVQEVSYTPSSL